MMTATAIEKVNQAADLLAEAALHLDSEATHEPCAGLSWRIEQRQHAHALRMTAAELRERLARGDR